MRHCAPPLPPYSMPPPLSTTVVSFHRRSQQNAMYCVLCPAPKYSLPWANDDHGKIQKEALLSWVPWGRKAKETFLTSLCSQLVGSRLASSSEKLQFSDSSLFFSFPFRPICLPSLLPQYSSDRPFLLAVKVARSLSLSFSHWGGGLPPSEAVFLFLLFLFSVCLHDLPPSFSSGRVVVGPPLFSLLFNYLSFSFVLGRRRPRSPLPSRPGAAAQKREAFATPLLLLCPIRTYVQ